MWKWLRRFSRRSSTPVQTTKPVDASIQSLSPEEFAELTGWVNRVALGDPAAEAVLVKIAEYYAHNWTKLFGILMDLDREQIRGEKVAELFTSCEGDMRRFEQAIA